VTSRVCEFGEHELRHAVVRDIPRADRDEADGYGGLRRDVAWRRRQQRLGSVEGKEAYVAVLEVRAIACVCRWS
jgi:hypothetical protein